MPNRPLVSFVLATHNRRDITLHTVRQVFGPGRPAGPFEVIVVDNASTDGTVDAIRSACPDAVVLAEGRNLGSCAKALGVERATGQYIVFLDDDSHPWPGSVDRMIEHFNADPRLGAAAFRVHLPDGREECSALPNVFVGCGVGFRAEAVREVGGLDLGFFMQAEEYDLAFRLVNAGWRVETFADLHVDHLKTPRARRSGRTVFYDTRNNLLIAARYLPAPLYGQYVQDWLQRYGWLARAEGRQAAYWRGRLAGWARGLIDRRRCADRRLSARAIEVLFRLDEIERRMGELASQGVRSVVFADLGKNVLAFHRAAARTGISVLAIGDDRFAATGRRYRGVPLLTLDDALAMQPDAVVVSNTSPVHAGRRRAMLAELTDRPVYCWFEHMSADHKRQAEAVTSRAEIVECVSGS